MLIQKSLSLKFCLILLVFSCSSKSRSIENRVKLENAFPSLSFNRPVDLQNAKDGTNRLFVVEQQGVISVFKNSRTVKEKVVFLDIQNLVDDRSNEEGLLGLAFHPNYKQNGFFYVNYTARPNKTIISRFKVSPNDINKADLNSELILLDINQPYGNHNGGQIAFGPDNFLYISTGDGGSAGDPKNNSQNRQTFLGAILRIDVDNQSDGLNYSIPSDNPFKNNSQFRSEIFAYGLRNVWRFSFDSENGNLWAADVGQNEIEEIDLIEKGKNYGWNIMEGSNCYNPVTNCNKEGLGLPIWEYNHNQGDRSITGGFVYRGKNIPELIGKYIYADFVSGRIWVLNVSNINNPDNKLLIDTNINIASFGTDENNELYLCGFDGNIYRFEK